MKVLRNGQWETVDTSGMDNQTMYEAIGDIFRDKVAPALQETEAENDDEKDIVIICAVTLLAVITGNRFGLSQNMRVMLFRSLRIGLGLTLQRMIGDDPELKD